MGRVDGVWYISYVDHSYVQTLEWKGLLGVIYKPR